MIRRGLERHTFTASVCRGCRSGLSVAIQDPKRGSSGQCRWPLARSLSNHSRAAVTEHKAGDTHCLLDHQLKHASAASLALTRPSLWEHWHGSSRGESRQPPPPRPGSTRLFSAVLLGPIYISLALLSGEGLRDRQGEATQWSNIISDVLTPPSHKTNVSYSDAIDNGDDEGYVNEGNLLGEDGQGGRLRYSGPSPAEQWHAHVERFFTMGAHHLGLYFRTEEITDHGSLPVSSDTAAEYVPKITTRLISVQDDLPPAAQNHDRDNGGGGGGPNPKGRFVLAQIAFNDVGEDDDPNDPDAVRPERDMNRTGQCASAVINDLERRLHQLGASRALLLTLDEGTYHTVYWDGRRFVTLLFLEFTPPPSH